METKPDPRVKTGENTWIPASCLFPPQTFSETSGSEGPEIQIIRIYRDSGAEQDSGSGIRVDFLDGPLVKRLDISGLQPGMGTPIRVLFAPGFLCSRLECQVRFSSMKKAFHLKGSSGLFPDEWEVPSDLPDWQGWIRICLTAYPVL
jgi:hypothetical protein